MYKCRYFSIKELVDKKTFESHPEWKLWWMFDDRLLKLIDAVRGELGPVSINTWDWGGNFTESGLRIAGMKHYNPASQHSFGRAADLKFRDHTANEVRTYLNYNYAKFAHIAQSITCEKDVSWVHLDVRSNNDGYNEF